MKDAAAPLEVLLDSCRGLLQQKRSRRAAGGREEGGEVERIKNQTQNLGQI